ncbi:hypothetical protein NZK35_23665 [Stieleria sp. ICT_E10.1]|uniref:hypothetical protein n=1 Tax=Stieleria sedimenti TaxID=2976331 RepID=UPI00218093BB|nr:hypothetical protein [Stieleria sedimenti]MCS7469659.1 hypothetical protein [Stieleria sedimenti]
MLVQRFFWVGLMLCTGTVGWSQDFATIYFGDPDIEEIVIDRLDAGDDPIKKGYDRLDMIAEPLFPSIGLFRSVTTTYRTLSR